jgi:hypothetical protein
MAYCSFELQGEDPMGNYLDGRLLPLPNKNLDEYRRMARKASKVGLALARCRKRFPACCLE